MDNRLCMVLALNGPLKRSDCADIENKSGLFCVQILCHAHPSNITEVLDEE